MLNYETLRQKYGREIVKNIGTIGKLSKTLGKNESHLRFNLHCKHKDVMPNYVKVKAQQNDEQVRKIIHKAEREILTHNIRLKIKKKTIIKQQIEEKSQQLKEIVEESEMEIVLLIVNKARIKEFELCRDRQKKKFGKLNGTRNQSQNVTNEEVTNVSNNSDKWVKNISKVTLTEDQITLLKKGANFAITPKEIPTDEFIVATEQASKYMTKGEALAMKAEVVEVLKTAKKPISNITKDERKAINELKTKRDITSRPSGGPLPPPCPKIRT